MGIIGKLRGRDRRLGERMYREWRLVFPLGGSLFVVLGMIQVANAMPPLLSTRALNGLLFILLGVTLIALRLTIFKDKNFK